MNPKCLIQLLLFLFFVLPKLNACTCDHHIEKFCGSVDQETIIFSCKVIDKIDIAHMVVETIEYLNLQTHNDTIIVLGHDGLNCGESLEDFHIGDTLILGTGEPFLLGAYDTLYYLDGCKTAFLRYMSGFSIGQITPDVTMIPYQQFLDELQSCMDFIASSKNNKSDKSISLNPNPANSFLNIHSDYKIEEIQLFDCSGQFIKNYGKGKDFSFRTELSDLPNGIFLIRVETEKGIRTRKLIVMH